MRQQITRARKYRKTEHFYSQREEVHKNKLVVNITFYHIFCKLKNILSRIHLLFSSDRENSKVFEIIPIITFTKVKSLKDVFVKEKVPPFENERFPVFLFLH